MLGVIRLGTFFFGLIFNFSCIATQLSLHKRILKRFFKSPVNSFISSLCLNLRFCIAICTFLNPIFPTFPCLLLNYDLWPDCLKTIAWCIIVILIIKIFFLWCRTNCGTESIKHGMLILFFIKMLISFVSKLFVVSMFSIREFCISLSGNLKWDKTI